jgi:hypothetical protein
MRAPLSAATPHTGGLYQQDDQEQEEENNETQQEPPVRGDSSQAPRKLPHGGAGLNHCPPHGSTKKR